MMFTEELVTMRRWLMLVRMSRSRFMSKSSSNGRTGGRKIACVMGHIY